MSIDESTLLEAIYFDGIRCRNCNERIDLSDVDEVSEAGERWNDHLRECPEVELAAEDIDSGEWLTYTDQEAK